MSFNSGRRIQQQAKRENLKVEELNVYGGMRPRPHRHSSEIQLQLCPLDLQKIQPAENAAANVIEEQE